MSILKKFTGRVINNMIRLKLVAFFCVPTVHAQTWIQKANIPEANGKGRWTAYGFAIGNKVYVGGGYIGNFISKNDFWEYDPATDAWTRKADIPGSANRTAAIAFSIDGKGYIGLGSQEYNTANYTFLKDLWQYDPQTNAWTQKASLPDSARSHAACFVIDGKAYVAGGQTGFPALASADLWMYNPQTDAWSEKAAMPAGAAYGAMPFVIGNKGYVAGGLYASGAGFINKPHLWQYLPAFNYWVKKSDYCDAKGRDHGVAFVLNNEAYVGLGKAKENTTTFYFKEFCKYNPVNNTWKSATDFQATDRAYAVAVSTGDRVFAGGGFLYLGTQVYYNDWWEMSLSTGVDDPHTPGQHAVIYPNPSNGIIKIRQAGYQSYRISDCIGNVVRQGVPDGSEEMNLTGLPSGVYVVSLFSNEQVMNIKLILR